MPSKLTEMIRAKYPGVYDDLDDATLEKQVLTKYPQYQDMVEPEKAQAASTKPEKSIMGFLGNVPASLGRLIGDTVSGVGSMAVEASPIGMARTLQDPGRIIRGAKAIPGAIVQSVKDRYGSFEKIGDTLYNDPAGVLADVSTLAGVGATAKVPRIAGQLRKIEQATNPLRIVGKPVVSAAARTGDKMQAGAISAYERMLKPNKTTLEGMPHLGGNLEQRSQAVAKALITDPNGQISKGGARRYGDATSEIQNKVDELVDQNPEARGSTKHLKDALHGGRGKFTKQWAPGSDTAQYDSVAEEVLNNPKITKKKRVVKDTSLEHSLDMAPADTEVIVEGRTLLPRITAQKARGLTQGTYRSLGDKAYGELKGASTEAHKAAARGGRAILNEAIPAVEPLNDAISKRIDLGQVLDEAVFRSGKHDPIGLSQQVVLSGVNPGLILGSLINRPGVGSPLARGLYGMGGKLTGTKTPEGIMQAALLARLLGESNE